MRFFSFKKIVSPFCQWTAFLVLIPVLELFLLLHFLGTWFTLTSMFVSGMLGMTIAYRRLLYYWGEFTEQLNRGEVPSLPFLHGLLILFALSLMILPGILTSLVGLFLFFPLARAFFVSYFLLQMEAQRFQKQRSKTSSPPEVIDV